MTESITLRCACHTWPSLAIPSSAFPLPSLVCHCSSCRLVTGNLCAHFVDLPEGIVPFDGDPEKYGVKQYKSSGNLTRWFCGKGCGAHLAVQIETSPGTHIWSLELGVVPSYLPSGQPTTKVSQHMFLNPEDGGGLTRFLPDGIPRWTGDPDKSARFDPSAPEPTEKAPDPLPVRCHCSSFSGSISRPSKTSLDVVSPEMRAHCVKGEKYHLSICICNDCRLNSGFPYSPFMSIPHSALTLSPTSKPLSFLKAFPSSDKVDRYHCPTCGAHVFYESKLLKSQGVVELGAGLVDAPLGAVMRDWWDKSEKVDYPQDAENKELAECLVQGWDKK